MRFISDKSGATMVEYGLLAALIAAVAVAAVTSLGQSVSEKFNEIATAVSAAGN